MQCIRAPNVFSQANYRSWHLTFQLDNPGAASMFIFFLLFQHTALFFHLKTLSTLKIKAQCIFNWCHGPLLPSKLPSHSKATTTATHLDHHQQWHLRRHTITYISAISHLLWRLLKSWLKNYDYMEEGLCSSLRMSISLQEVFNRWTFAESSTACTVNLIKKLIQRQRQKSFV